MRRKISFVLVEGTRQWLTKKDIIEGLKDTFNVPLYNDKVTNIKIEREG